MKKQNNISLRLKRNGILLLMMESIHKKIQNVFFYIAERKIELLQDGLIMNFIKDWIKLQSKYFALIKEDHNQIKFEFQKVESAKCKNLDEFIDMVFSKTDN